MPLWNEVDLNLVEVKQSGTTRTKASYASGPLRFQIPRGYLRYGFSQYKTISISNLDPKFQEWFLSLEKVVSEGSEPFKSAFSEYGLRLNADDTTLVFNHKGEYVSDEHVEGYLKDFDISCIVDVEGAYLWKGVWALSCKVYQMKFYEPAPKIPEFEMVEDEESSTTLSGCAFLP